jgi:hypothetical protein
MCTLKLQGKERLGKENNLHYSCNSKLVYGTQSCYPYTRNIMFAEGSVCHCLMIIHSRANEHVNC